MQITDPATLEWRPYSEHRGMNNLIKRLAKGTPGSPNNFEFIMFRTSKLNQARHRHNFNQLRVPVDGDLIYAPGQSIAVGKIGFVHEGVSYGPYEDAGTKISVYVQFGGASGQSYLGYDELGPAAARLREEEGGWYEGGYYWYKNESGTALRKDGYQAAWEFANNQRMHYPRPRYGEPLVMDPDAFCWRPTAAAGVEQKVIGVLDERDTRIAMYRCTSEATIQFDAQPRERLYLWLEPGDGVFIESQLYGRHTGIHLASGEKLAVSTPTGGQVLELTLPDFQSVS